MLHYGKPDILNTTEVSLTCYTKIGKKCYSLDSLPHANFFLFLNVGKVRYSQQLTLAGKSNNGQFFNVLKQKMLPPNHCEFTQSQNLVLNSTLFYLPFLYCKKQNTCCFVNLQPDHFSVFSHLHGKNHHQKEFINEDEAYVHFLWLL